jgi:hypothetical protein
VSATQATGTLTTIVAADNTLTIQLARANLSTEPLQAAGTVQINLNSGQLTLQIVNATPNAAYAATFLASSPSATLQLGSLTTGPDGLGSMQANLSSGTYFGMFQITRLNIVEYASITTSFVIGSSSINSTTLSSTSTQFSTQSTQNQITTPTNTTAQATLQIQPISNTISPGAFAKFDIHIVDNSTAKVSLVARQVPPDSVAIFTPNVGLANPDFYSSLTIVTSVDTPPGNYNVTAVAIIDGKEFTQSISLQVLVSSSVTASNNITTSVSVSNTLAISVATDQPRYQPNSTVNIQGQVTDSTGSAVADATVTIQVDAPTGVELFYTNTVHTDKAGSFQAQVGLISSSPVGTYTVFTSASKSGYSSVTTRTAFVVGASTTPSVIIKAVYTNDSAGKPSSTFSADQTVSVTVVIDNIGTTFQGVVWIQVRDPSGAPVQIQYVVARLDSGETKDEFGFTLLGHPTIGVYTVNVLVSDKLISQGGIFLASSETEFALIG